MEFNRNEKREIERTGGKEMIDPEFIKTIILTSILAILIIISYFLNKREKDVWKR
jgi:hypothetical protein